MGCIARQTWGSSSRRDSREFVYASVEPLTIYRRIAQLVCDEERGSAFGYRNRSKLAPSVKRQASSFLPVEQHGYELWLRVLESVGRERKRTEQGNEGWAMNASR